MVQPTNPRASIPSDEGDDLTDVERWAFNGLKAARDAVYDPRTGRATGIGTALPVFAPALDAVADFREGDYAGAALNTAFAVGDVLPGAAAGKILRLGKKIGWKNLIRTDLKYKKARDLLKEAGYVGKNQEVHHIFPVGKKRNTGNWRNNPLLLKPMEQSNHQRLTRSWKGMPQHSFPAKVWHGTNDWQKLVSADIGSYAADAAENRIATVPPSQKSR